GIKAELNSTYINHVYKNYANSWEDIRKRLYDSEDFGVQLDRINLVKNLLPAEVKNLPVQERAATVLKYVQNNFTYNKEDDVVVDKGIRNLLSTKVGNSAEINILLTLLLRSVDIAADPVALST